MQSFEYLTVPAPTKGAKVKGLKTASERYAYQLTTLLNQLAGEGWEFWRAETLPSEERKGLTGTMQVMHHLLIFRRQSADALVETLVQPETRASNLVANSGPVPPVGGGAVYASRTEPQLRDQIE